MTVNSGDNLIEADTTAYYVTVPNTTEKITIVAAPSDANATVKIVDNSRDFTDASAAHTFNDAVDFASACGIVESYRNGSFGVGGYATSAAIAAVIACIMGEDFYGSGSTAKAQD
mgnify:CR=1 FL=1